MSIKDEFAVGPKLMHLDARLPKGNVLVCAGKGDDHSFILRRLGLSVECPRCGQIALSVDLVADFYTRSMEGSVVRAVNYHKVGGPPSMETSPATPILRPPSGS